MREASSLSASRTCGKRFCSVSDDGRSLVRHALAPALGELAPTTRALRTVRLTHSLAYRALASPPECLMMIGTNLPAFLEHTYL